MFGTGDQIIFYPIPKIMFVFYVENFIYFVCERYSMSETSCVLIY